MTEEELRVLAWTILGEAGGEGSAGQLAVAHVIRNRALSGRFPSNPAAVALQSNASGIHQFSTWNALSQGGNIPRSRYPVGSTSFQAAYNIAARVFGATPGNDPTQGATHYYSPKGMPGGAAPYWWRSEAPKGEKRIGGHIFAIKRATPTAPTPAQRSVTADKGTFPSKGQMTMFRSGSPAQLPVIGPTGGPSLKKAPRPARQSLAMEKSRGVTREAEPAGEVVMIFDPVTNSFVKPMPTAASVRRNIPQSQIERMPARTVQRVAGFSVPGGVDGIKQVDDARRRETLKSTQPTFAGQDRSPRRTVTARPNTQTTFAQPTGSLTTKDEAQLAPGVRDVDPILRVESGGLSRDAVAARARGVAMGSVVPVTKLPPMPIARPQRPPVAVVTPPPRLRIVVQRDPVAAVIRTPPRSLYYTDPVAFGNAAVSQSGDDSVGSQADAAAARASGEAWRNSR